MEKFWKHKSKFAAIALVLLMASVLLTLYIPVQAQDEYENMQEGGSIPLPAGVTPDLTLETHPYLSFRPNPVGVGQTFLVNLWLVPPLHVSRYFSDYKVTITDPDGNEDVITMDSYRADTTAWFEYVVDQVGTWKLKFEFPGGYFPPGNYTIYAGAVLSLTSDQVVSFEESVYYKPSSTEEQTLIVQEEMVYSWPPSLLPTDYWTRPVSLENREWWPILGGFPGTGYVGGGSVWDELYPDTNPRWSSQYDFHPWVQGPNSAHVVWRRQGSLGGLIGGPIGYYGETAGAGAPMPSAPSLIYSGRAYDIYTNAETEETLWRCSDLRTGEVYWEKPVATTTSTFFGMTFVSTLTPNIISYGHAYATIAGMPAVPGGAAGAGWTVDLLAISGGYLTKWDPYTGIVTTNVSIAPLTSGTYYRNEYALSVQNLGGGNYRLINWTTTGDTDNFTERVVSNTTYARSSLPSLIDYNVGIGATVSSVTPSATQVTTQTRIRGYSLTTGEELWDITVDEAMYSGGCSVADHGKVAFLAKNGYYLAYDLYSGNLAWKSETMDYPWGEASFGAYAIQSAYGLFYRQAYDGVYAFNWTDGSMAWKYKAPAIPYETPYIDENGEGVYSFNAGAIIADGKLFTYNTEHTPSLPITRGWRLHCMDAITGEGIWNITGLMAPSAVADGYLTAGNGYDGYVYVFGKGQSATTIEAPLTAISLGQSVVLRGTVLDMSPAQPGTPCVSKDSMTGWMEYLHMQKPIPEEVTGVPVSLDTLDPNGNFVHIGDVTTDMSGMFKKMWTPEVPGEYTVIATFMGDDSYGSSYAETAVGVVEAPEEPEPVTPATEPEVQENIDRAVENLNNSIMPILYGTIVAVIVVALLVIYDIFFRKRQ